MNILFSRKDTFIGEECLHYAIKFISLASELAETQKPLRPHVHKLLETSVLPTLYVTVKDIETFTEDPIAFVRSQCGAGADTEVEPQKAIQELLVNLTKPAPDGDSQVLTDFFGFALKLLDKYDQDLKREEPQDWRVKDALMHALGLVKHHISGNEICKNQMEQILLRHFMPELISLQPMLRSRAGWAFDVFAQQTYQNDADLDKIIHGCHNNMFKFRGQPLPVMFYGGLAISSILLKNKEALKHTDTKVYLIIKNFITLQMLFDSEIYMRAFQDVIDVFGRQLDPYAVHICKHLAVQYIRCINDGSDSEEAIHISEITFRCMQKLLELSCFEGPEAYILLP